MAGLRALDREKTRSLAWGGLRLVLTSPGALLWTYGFNLGLALLFSLRLHAQMASVLDHSLAAERLSSAFDLGTLLGVQHSLAYHAPASGSSSYLGLPVYLLVYFVLVPGALFVYRTEAPGRLSILLGTGLGFFWRFVRITILTAIVCAGILGPLIAAQNAWAGHVDERYVGITVWLLEAPGALLVVLMAALLRVYFDLVEVYTVQLNDQLLPSGKPDRRVRRVLRPALRTLAKNFRRAYGTFLGLAVLGLVALGVTWAGTTELLAQRHVLPIFLLSQLGLFFSLLTRFWQRGAETVLAADNRLAGPAVLSSMDNLYSPEEATWARAGEEPDAQSDPEPAVPSLNEPDPAVFHPEPATPTPEEP